MSTLKTGVSHDDRDEIIVGCGDWVPTLPVPAILAVVVLMKTPPVSLWTVYDRPKDYPNSFVARRFLIDAYGAKPTESIIISDNLRVLRNILAYEMHLTCLNREQGDDPNIVESWI